MIKCTALSLVELSIVLVILGLLVGGVLSGQSLVRAAELRAVSNDITRYITATNTFRDKYFSYPGDLPNATKFWGVQNAAPAVCQSTPSTTKLTCDGDGDGFIGAAGGFYSYEQLRYWQHLANAGLIEGTYAGVGSFSDGGGNYAPYNSPATRLQGVTFAVRYWGTMDSSSPDMYPGTYGHIYYLGISRPNWEPFDPFMTPAEAWNIDTKIDDGKPGTGKIRSWLYGNVTGWASAMANCADNADPNLAKYSVQRTTKDCSLLISW
jgi:type II secretory pathway pseudopilin PulG